MAKGFSESVSPRGNEMGRVEPAVPASPCNPSSCQQSWEDINRRRKADPGGSPQGAGLGNAGIIPSSFWPGLKGSTEPIAKGWRHWNTPQNTPADLLIAILDLLPFPAGSQQQARSQLGCGFVYFPANGAAGAVPENETGNVRKALSSSHR